MREQLIREVEIIPLEVVVRNVAAGSLSKRLGLEEGTQLPRSIIEFYYKNDNLNDPMVSEEHITAFSWATPQEIDEVMQLALRVNDFLVGLFLGIGIRLVDFKIEFGRLWDNEQMRIVLADEISPDCCRLWDITPGDKLDKDRFRRDLGGVLEAYQEVARRLGVLTENRPPKGVGPVARRVEPDRKTQLMDGSRGEAVGSRALKAPVAVAYCLLPDCPRTAMKARIKITLKSGVLDPQGKAIQNALGALGFEGVNDVRQGKYIEVDVAGMSEDKARAEVERMCRDLLANTVIENYSFELAP